MRRGVDALLEGKLDGLNYDQMVARAPWAISAYEGWIARVNESRLDRAYALRHPKQGAKG